MKIPISESAKEDLDFWYKTDPKKKERIKTLVKAILEAPLDGIGKPEALKHNWSGYWTRRMDRQQRLIYRVHEENLEIIRCRFHY